VLFFRQQRLHTIIEKTTPHLLGDLDDILKDVEKDLGELLSPVIVCLLQGKQPPKEELEKKLPEK
jgi:hypothetical protein